MNPTNMQRCAREGDYCSCDVGISSIVEWYVWWWKLVTAINRCFNQHTTIVSRYLECIVGNVGYSTWSIFYKNHSRAASARHNNSSRSGLIIEFLTRVDTPRYVLLDAANCS